MRALHRIAGVSSIAPKDSLASAFISVKVALKLPGTIALFKSAVYTAVSDRVSGTNSMHSALRPLWRAALAGRKLQATAALRRSCSVQFVTPYSRHAHASRWISSKSNSHDPSSNDNHVPKPRFHMVFTCKKCDTRAVKSFTKDAYEKGVVLVTCPGCQARHVIADNLGWFGEDRNVEEILAKKGESVKRITDGDLDFSH